LEDYLFVPQLLQLPSTQVLQSDPLVPSVLRIEAVPFNLPNRVNTLLTSELLHLGQAKPLGVSFMPFSISNTLEHLAHL
jgi:hypothetical protein